MFALLVAGLAPAGVAEAQPAGYQLTYQPSPCEQALVTAWRSAPRVYAGMDCGEAASALHERLLIGGARRMVAGTVFLGAGALAIGGGLVWAGYGGWIGAAMVTMVGVGLVPAGITLLARGGRFRRRARRLADGVELRLGLQGPGLSLSGTWG